MGDGGGKHAQTSTSVCSPVTVRFSLPCWANHHVPRFRYRFRAFFFTPECSHIQRMKQPFSEEKGGARYRVRTCVTGTQPEGLSKGCTQIDTHELQSGFNICELIAAWPSLPPPIQEAVLAIVRPYASGLSINRESESANRAKVAAVRAAKRQSSDAGAQPEQPVCGQGTVPTGEDFGRDDSVSRHPAGKPKRKKHESKSTHRQ